MYLLDTNVIAELRKATSPKVDHKVLGWATSVSTASLFLSVITVLELETGTLLVERRDPTQGAVLRSWLNTHVLPAFSDRILPVDTQWHSVVPDFMFPIPARIAMRSSRPRHWFTA